jgi:hypothetical protein
MSSWHSISLILWHQVTESVPYFDLDLLHLSFQHLKPVIHGLKPLSHLNVHSLELLTPMSVNGLQPLCNMGQCT